MAGVVTMAALVAGVVANDAGAQEPPLRTIADAVYSMAQAKRGSETFAGMCQSCHTPAQYEGPTFLDAWRGYTLWDFFEYLTGTMPKSDPGGLSPQEYAQVVAWVLELNDMPPGPDDLPADPAALKQIRFDTAGIDSQESQRRRRQTTQ